MPRSLRQFLFLLSLGWVSACTAWEYDIASCDVHARDLNKDVCNTLNTDPNSCMIYQCDGPTASCIQTPRDFDRDGDPDIACGGTDCNDFDPTIYGRQGDLCTCKPEVLDQPCTVGQSGSACVRTSKYVCSNAALNCPATPGTPMTDYQAGPDPVNNSWDWNCDGIVDQACSWLANGGRYNRADCPMTTCNATQMMQIAGDGELDLCTAYCANLAQTDCDATNTNPYVFNCDAQPFCGSRVGVCYCSWGHPAAHILGYCESQPISTIGSIYCR